MRSGIMSWSRSALRRRRRLVERRGIVARGQFAPRRTLQHGLASNLVELDHVGLLERLAQLVGEALRNISDVVADVVALAEHIELVKIADALCVDQRRYGAAG